MISTAKRRAIISTQRIEWARRIAKSDKTVADIAKVLHKTADHLKDDLHATRAIAAATAIEMEAAVRYLEIVNAPAQHEHPHVTASRL